ncbi:MAG: hypothetical protein MK212_07260 [Saprospiraceae bacterium]|nr:hypothetical protein [Saprospiraceae bacterium]
MNQKPFYQKNALLIFLLIFNLGSLYLLLSFKQENANKEISLAELQKEKIFHDHLASQQITLDTLKKYLAQNQQVISPHYQDIPSKILYDLFVEPGSVLYQEVDSIVQQVNDRDTEIQLLKDALSEAELDSFPTDNGNFLVRLYTQNPDLPYHEFIQIKKIALSMTLSKIKYRVNPFGQRIDILEHETNILVASPSIDFGSVNRFFAYVDLHIDLYKNSYEYPSPLQKPSTHYILECMEGYGDSKSHVYIERDAVGKDGFLQECIDMFYEIFDKNLKK